MGCSRWTLASGQRSRLPVRGRLPRHFTAWSDQERRNSMASSHGGSHERGHIKDPENDGRLKENREAGRTKGTTPGSEARAQEHGRDPAHNGSSSHSGSSSKG